MPGLREGEGSACSLGTRFQFETMEVDGDDGCAATMNVLNISGKMIKLVCVLPHLKLFFFLKEIV